MTTLATDNFTRANSGTLGANWTNIAAGIGIVSNKAQATNPNTGLSTYSGFGAFPNDQWAQVTVGTTLSNGSDAIGAGVRVSGTSAANDNGYFIFVTSLGSALVKIIAGAETVLASGGTGWSTGDTLYIAVQGTSITVQKNGSIVSAYTLTDPSLTGGLPGILCGAAVEAAAAVTAFSAGNFNQTASIAWING